jgi:hypothetical protein
MKTGFSRRVKMSRNSPIVRKHNHFLSYFSALLQFSDSNYFYYLVIAYLRLVTAIEICTEVEKFCDFEPKIDRLNPDVVSLYFLCDLKCSK